MSQNGHVAIDGGDGDFCEFRSRSPNEQPFVASFMEGNTALLGSTELDLHLRKMFINNSVLHNVLFATAATQFTIREDRMWLNAAIEGMGFSWSAE